MCTIPERFIEYNLRDMEIGEIAYTEPWALYQHDGRCYLNGDYIAHDKQWPHAGKGQVTLIWVRRLINGYEVTLPKDCDHTWSEEHSMWGDPLPVVNIRVV